MNKNKLALSKIFALLTIATLALSTMACNLLSLVGFEPSYAPPPAYEQSHWEGEPQFEGEPHFEGDPDFEGEPHFEGEPPFEGDPHFEGEPQHHEEPRPEEQHPPEPQPQQPQPPQPQPQQPQQPPAPSNTGANWTTDIAVTDIYPGNQPFGQFHVRITNHGPGTLNKVKVNVSCSAERSDKKTGQLSSGGNVNFIVKLNLKPGEQQSAPTGLKLDANTFDYLVGCEVHPGFNDTNNGNNVYSETLK